MSLPILQPQDWIRYAAATDLYVAAEEGPGHGPLQGFYADRFGWQEEADSVNSVVASLSVSDQSRLSILCDDYGEASALQFLSPSLSSVISGQNNYWLWGPGTNTGEVVLIISGRPLTALREEYEQVDIVGTMDSSSLQMPYVRQETMYLARKRHRSLQADWFHFKKFI